MKSSPSQSKYTKRRYLRLSIKKGIKHSKEEKESGIMKFLQKLGKALMLPVACLPICGILMGL